MRIVTAPGRPELHVSYDGGTRIVVSQLPEAGRQQRFRLTMSEALTLADALVDAVEYAASS